LEAYQGEAIPDEEDASSVAESSLEFSGASLPPRFVVPLLSEEQRIVENLNIDQRSAVTLSANAGPVMVFAGAGTGKTAVLTRRIAYLHACGVDPRQILAVTFTNKAAREMKERLQKLGVNPLPLVGTFHAIGLRILKRCPEAAGVDHRFTVMDESDTKALWKRLFVLPKRKEGKEPPPRAPHFKLQLNQDDDRIPMFEKAMFQLKERGIRSSKDVTDEFVAAHMFDMLKVYEAERMRLNMVDFSDLISASLHAIQKTEIGKRWASMFTHVLVDEFQDTSSLQFEWATSILSGRPGGKEAQNLFCVGDDNQSIYSFRGAVIENISRFVKEFKAIEVMLEQNYRCGSHILDAANRLIARNPGGSRKRLWTDSTSGSVQFRKFPRDSDEARWIAEDVRGSKLAERSAILTRTRAAMIPIMTALRFTSVAYHVVGAQDFFDRREIRDAMALLRLAANPADELSFARVALMFPGVGKTTVDKIVQVAKETGEPAASICLKHSSPKIQAVGAAFEGMSHESPAEKTILALVHSSGLWEECTNDEDQMRIVNLKEFIEMGGQFGIVGEFLEEMTLFSEKKGKEDGVTVSTIHAAKGLEWDRVYLPALCQGHLPSERIEVSTKDDITPEKIARKQKENLEEERRLMYVAITRAKRYLSTSWSTTRLIHGQIIKTTKSQFISEAGLGDYLIRTDTARAA
jgi:DNA helicase-2/ATP-dependent DNA helicase PcrA